jgi:hypothetical protein
MSREAQRGWVDDSPQNTGPFTRQVFVNLKERCQTLPRKDYPQFEPLKSQST